MEKFNPITESKIMEGHSSGFSPGLATLRIEEMNPSESCSLVDILSLGFEYKSFKVSFSGD